jgi:hypothetical protein
MYILAFVYNRLYKKSFLMSLYNKPYRNPFLLTLQKYTLQECIYWHSYTIGSTRSRSFMPLNNRLYMHSFLHAHKQHILEQFTATQTKASTCLRAVTANANGLFAFRSWEMIDVAVC